MSNLSIGLVTSPSEESKQLISLLEGLGTQVCYHISPDEIKNAHIDDQSLNVWLLNVEDDHWHDNIDKLLDESEASIYFNEPGTLSKQSHPEFWCQKLVSRLYELAGLSVPDSSQPTNKEKAHKETIQKSSKGSSLAKKITVEPPPTTNAVLDSAENLNLAIDELAISSAGLSSDVAADLVSELESLSPELDAHSNHSASHSLEIKSASTNVENTPLEIETEVETEVEAEIEIDDENSSADAESLIDQMMSLDEDLSFDENFTLEDDLPAILEDNEIEKGKSSAIPSESIKETSEISDEITVLGQTPSNDQSDDQSDEQANISEPLEVSSAESSELVQATNDHGVTLELLDDNQQQSVSGKAQYVIDDQPQESDLSDQQPTESLEITNTKTPETPEIPIEEEWLSADDVLNPPHSTSEGVGQGLEEETLLDHQNDDVTIALKTIPDEARSSLEEDELTFDFENIENTQEILIEAPVPAPSPVSTADEVSQNFDIPMLEEAATGLDFEQLAEQNTNQLTPCWVVGASLGGPAAVKRFLQSLPADINVSFIVVQHIDENFLPVLAEILTSNSHFNVEVATGSNTISAGKIYLAPLKGKLVFLKDGSMLVDHSQKWSAPYMPCIDDVVESLASIYSEQSGAIIFSGMGHDGLEGVKKMKLLGGQVWAQSVDTCANSSMPEAIINAGLADVVAAPEMLADRLVEHISSNLN